MKTKPCLEKGNKLQIRFGKIKVQRRVKASKLDLKQV